jgi:tRNA modification GTPase
MHDTIAAICTAPGAAALSVIRISGKEALAIGDKIFSKKTSLLPSHTAHFGKIVKSTGGALDEVILLVMLEGRSFTGENTIEIMCHGGVYVTQKVLNRIFEAGARAANPGEFTERAYRNGRIDLAQAEAIQTLIAAKNEEALLAAEKQLSGQLSIRIKELQASLTEITAILEAWVDYPEEGLEFATKEELLEMLETASSKMERLLSTFHDGKKLVNGISLCLLGAPNVGKSSLLNALLDEERAIVTNIPGTTRDLLHEEIRLKGHSFRITDTAGLRETEEVIEKEGIKRSKKAAESADLVLLLLDITKEPSSEEREWANLPNCLIVYNKSDLPHKEPKLSGIAVSAKEKIGLDSLKDAILQKALPTTTSHSDQIILTQERHYLSLKKAQESLTTVISGFTTDISPEFLVFDLRASLKHLSAILGTNITEAILDSIFKKFCVGK